MRTLVTRTHRVDVRSSSRHVLARHAGVVVAESGRPKLLFETGLPVRYYLPFADVRIDLLELSGTISECPYKGDGQHWNLAGASDVVADAAWSLPHPLAEASLALDHIGFYPDKLEVDGRSRARHVMTTALGSSPPRRQPEEAGHMEIGSGLLGMLSA